jgi:hypothetical protein
MVTKKLLSVGPHCSKVGLLRAMSKPLNEHYPTEFAREISPQRAPQIEQEAKQQMMSPQREIQASEPATLPTRWSARNAPKQARFRYNGTQSGGYVAQVTVVHPTLSLRRNLSWT